MEPEPQADDAPRYPHRDRDAGWVAAVRAGDERAFGWIYDAWFDRVFDLSMRIVRDRDVALEVTQDAFLSAWRNLDSLNDPGSFGGWLLRIARNGSLNRAEKERRSAAVDDQELAVMEAVGASSAGAPAGFALEDRLAATHDPQQVVEDNEMQQLVWQAASALGERDTEVLDLQLRHGLTPAEVGDVLGINRNAANQLVHRVRKRFEVALKARLLWRGAQPACADLQALLRSAGVESFSAEAVKIADQHAPACEACRERRESRLQPAAMFAAVPLIAVPIVFKQQAAYALDGSGVPMSGSEFSREAVLGQGNAMGDGSVEPSPDAPNGSFGDGSVHPAPEVLESEGRGGHPVRRGLLMAAAAAVLVVLFSAIVTARLHDPTSNEVVAFSQSGPSGSTAAPGGTNVNGSDATTPIDGGTGPSTDSLPDGDPSSTTPSDPGPTVTVPSGGSPSPSTVPPGGSPTTDPGGGQIGGPSPSSSIPTLPRTGATADLALSVVTVPTQYPMTRAPTLTWHATGGASQHVGGPNVDQASADGSQQVCAGTIRPTTNGAPVCVTAKGTYTFALVVYDGGGTVLAQKTVTLTVN
jgi:RNA polymerase sigma factor (sigma-70 family)